MGRLLIKKFIFDIAVVLDSYWKTLIRKLLTVEEEKFTDPLTGLYNRRFLTQELLDRLTLSCHTFSLALIDLDDFKKINDRYGHLEGDLVLRGFARFLSSSFKGKDYIIRYGGDEFLVLLIDVRKRLGDKLMRKLLTELQETGIHLHVGRKAYLSFSWGIAEYPTDSVSLDELIEIADRRMYSRKRRRKSKGEGRSFLSDTL